MEWIQKNLFKPPAAAGDHSIDTAPSRSLSAIRDYFSSPKIEREPTELFSRRPALFTGNVCTIFMSGFRSLLELSADHTSLERQNRTDDGTLRPPVEGGAVDGTDPDVALRCLPQRAVCQRQPVSSLQGESVLHLQNKGVRG